MSYSTFLYTTHATIYSISHTSLIRDNMMEKAKNQKVPTEIYQKVWKSIWTNLDGHDGECDPETADWVGDEDEADDHHEGRSHQHWLDGLKENGWTMVRISELFSFCDHILPGALFPSTGQCRWSRGGTQTPLENQMRKKDLEAGSRYYQ